jgi:hypothetical protein
MRFGVTSFLLKALATAALLAPTSFVTAGPCNVAVKMRASRASKLYTGKTFYAAVGVKNTGVTALTNLYVQIQLPDFLVPIKATISKHASVGAPSPILQEEYIWFPKLTLAAKKALTVKMRIGVPHCQPAGTKQIKGIVYQLDANGLVICSTLATPYRINVIQKNLGFKYAKWDRGCVTPTPVPTSTFVQVGANQRCLEARLLGSRRERELAKGEWQAKEAERELANSYTSNQCYQACGDYLGATGQYFFNLDTAGNCYCCETCEPIYDPFFTVRRRYICVCVCVSSSHVCQ